MSDQPDIPAVKAEPLSEEHKRLLATFDAIETNQLEFLDEAGKRIIELVTVLFGALLTFIAFGDTFPPSYLANKPLNQILTVIILLLYLVALAFAASATLPRTIKRYPYNLTKMRAELDKLIAGKKKDVQVAGAFFITATGFLALFLAKLVIVGA